MHWNNIGGGVCFTKYITITCVCKYLKIFSWLNVADKEAQAKMANNCGVGVREEREREEGGKWKRKGAGGRKGRRHERDGDRERAHFCEWSYKLSFNWDGWSCLVEFPWSRGRFWTMHLVETLAL
jgi:hypothetical protein